MSSKDLMLKYLQEEGFRPKVLEFGIEFRFEGGNFLFINNDNDPNYFQLAFPAIYDVTPDNRVRVLEALNSANANAKVAKLYTIGEKVWVFFEILLDSTPELADFVPRALAMLRNGQAEFYKYMGE